MKKWILPLLAAALLLGGCGVMGETREQRLEREAREAQYVTDFVRNGDFSVRIDHMYPLRGVGKAVTNYSVTVKDGVLDSHLPYIGQAWRVPYGGGHALNFKADILNYSVSEYKKDGYEVRIYVKTDEDEHLYLLHIFDNGSTSLSVESGNRDRISYSGFMEFPAE